MIKKIIHMQNNNNKSPDFQGVGEEQQVYIVLQSAEFI